MDSDSVIRDTSRQDKLIQPNAKQRLKLPLIAAVVTLLLAGLVWANLQASETRHSVSRDELRLATLTIGTLERDVATTGKVVAANAPILYSPVKGELTLLVDPGDQVSKGDVVATIDSPTLTNNLLQQQATYQAMQSDLERARLSARRERLEIQKTLDIARVDLDAAARERRRGDKLIKDHLISSIDYEKSKDELNKAKLQLAHAQMEAELMQDTVAFELKNKELEVSRQQLVVGELERQVQALRIQAPVDGIVGNWLSAQKAQVSQSQPLLTIVDLSAYEAELAVPEAYADDLGLGMAVELSFGEKKVAGKLASISPEVRNREVTARVRFEQSDDLKIRQNQRLSARILLESRADVLMVKRGAFISTGNSEYAYRLRGEHAVKTPIKLGARSMSHIEVLQGGEPGDVWITSTLAPFKQADQVLLH